MKRWLRSPRIPFNHLIAPRGNIANLFESAANLKQQVLMREVVAAATNGKLAFGAWEQIFSGEFDGRRRKWVLVKIISE